MSNKANKAMVDSMGMNGGLEITDTSAHTGDWVAIAFLEETVIGSVTSNITDFGSATSYPAGLVIPVNITAITLTSGSVIVWEGD
jgi:hypothetical protein